LKKRFGFSKYLFHSGQSRANHSQTFKNTIETHQSKMKVGVLGCMAERLKDQFLEEEKL
jgi:tRNA A37 methylthiotransferase MiaB